MGEAELAEWGGQGGGGRRGAVGAVAPALWPCEGTAMMIKFLAQGTGSAAKAAKYLTRELGPIAQDQDPDQNPEEV